MVAINSKCTDCKIQKKVENFKPPMSTLTYFEPHLDSLRLFRSKCCFAKNVIMEKHVEVVTRYGDCKYWFRA